MVLFSASSSVRKSCVYQGKPMLGLVTADFQHFVRAGGFFFYSQIMDKEKTQGRERERTGFSFGRLCDPIEVFTFPTTPFPTLG